MKRFFQPFGFLAAFWLLVSVSEAANSTITYFGIGDLRVGMTSTQLRNAGFHFPKNVSKAGSCYETPLMKNKKLLVMLEDGRLTRVSTANPRFRTTAGIGVGSTESEVKRAYAGSLKVIPHKYDEHGHYLILESNAGTHAIVMETDGAKVTNIHAGLEGPAQYVEGCL